MAILESFSPVFKASLNYEVDRTGCRPEARSLYQVSPSGDERLLIPAGRGTYDLYVFCTPPHISGKETDQDLRALANRPGRLRVEDRAPHLIGNATYIFSAQSWGQKFVRSRSRIAGPGTRTRYWFFSAKEDEGVIMARIRSLAGRLYTARATAIAEACRKKRIEPYKDLARVIAFFTDIGESLTKYGARIVERCRKKKAAAPPVETHPGRDRDHAGRIILDGCRIFFPDLYEPVRAMMGSLYPAGPPGPGPRGSGG